MTTRPNRHALAMLAILMTIWYAGAAQQNGTAYVLAFLLASLLLVSFLHARQHLRGLTITAGSVPSVRQGQTMVLPLTLATEDGREATGLNVMSATSAAPVFVEKVTADAPVHTALTLRALEVGNQADVAVFVTSRFPLGFFTSTIAVQVPTPHKVYPVPTGDLPLPAAKEDATVPESAPGASTSAQSGGDDFNGLRTWAPGDPLRHVDWRAVARGRPMMVKQFTGGSRPAVELDWDTLDLSGRERAQQLAKWIDEAANQGLRYSLKLPDVTIPAASGPEHRRRCLDVLSAYVTGMDDDSRMIVRKTKLLYLDSQESKASIPGRPLGLMASAIALTALPMIGAVPWAGVLVFFFSLLLRWWRGKRGTVSLGWRLLIVSAGISGVFAQTGTLFGVEAGIAFLLILSAAKVLESRTPRDLQVLAVMGWVLCLCALVLEQNLTRALYVMVSVLLISMALVRMRRGTAGVAAPLKTTLLLTAQALPLVALMFLFFPRGTAGLVTSLTRSLQHQTGITDDVNPGSIAKVAESDAPAFRATVTGRVLNPNELYWRCLTLMQCDGLHWRKGAFTSALRVGTAKAPIRQTISLEPHGSLWLPSLDRPSKIVKGGRDCYLDDTEQVLRSHDPVRFARRYEVESADGAGAMTLSQSLLTICRATPRKVSPQVQALAESFRAGGKDDRQIVAAALKHFETGGYSYTLQPGEYGDSALDEFLFQRKVGFCEHYASAFGTLMRLAGVPTRLVVGYLGGELFGDYYIVRQYNAHVWAEVFIEGSGWTRVDPTAALAPSRLSSDFRNLMADSFDVGFSLPRDAWWGQALLRVQMYWDNLNYQWFTRVVQFGEDEQYSLFASWGLASIAKLAATTLALLSVVVALLWWWIKRPTLHPDPAVRLWNKVCARLAKKGLGRAANEAPLAYARRVPLVRPLAELYVSHRYGRSPVSLAMLKAAALEVFHSPVQASSKKSF